MSSPIRRSVVIVQHAGDYAEAYRRIRSGSGETYYAQSYSLDVVGALVSPTTAVTTICCSSELDEDTVLDNGVRVINLRAQEQVDEDRVWRLIRECGATHLLLRTPQNQVLRQALADPSIESVLLTLADSFGSEGLRNRVRAWRMRRLFNHPKVAWIGNHGINSSESLRRIGVDPARIVPWDWPHDITPHQFTAKASRAERPWSLLFVGAVVETKGIGDVLRALRALKDKGIAVRLSYAGKGDTAAYAALATELQIADQVSYLGLVKHSAVIPLMRDADLVIVPSRHEYPEGFPMTIYEALSSRTPIVASDHPMYGRHLGETKAAFIYPAGDHQALAAAIETLMAEPARYAALSNASAASWDRLQLPVTWGKLMTDWLLPLPEQRSALSKYALAAYPPKA
ncbi:MAG: glycosyltransferase [Burkholderiales bacterium]